MNATKIEGIALITLLAVAYGCGPLLGQSRPTGNSSSEQGQQLQGKLTKGKPPEKGKIDFDVFRRLKKSSDGRVYVMVTLKPFPEEAVSDQQRRAAAKKSQDELLARTGTDQFEVGYRFQRDPILFGDANAGALAKLAKDPEVVSVKVKVEAKVHQELRDSSDGTVLVSVGLVPVKREGRTFEQRLALVEQIQDRVLGRIDPNEFAANWKFRLTPDLGGWASARGLEQLALDPDVVEIGAVSKVSVPEVEVRKKVSGRISTGLENFPDTFLGPRWCRSGCFKMICRSSSDRRS